MTGLYSFFHPRSEIRRGDLTMSVLGSKITYVIKKITATKKATPNERG